MRNFIGYSFKLLLYIYIYIYIYILFLRHESSGGYYRVSVFFLAKILTDLLILRFLPLTLYCVVTYFMIGK